MSDDKKPALSPQEQQQSEDAAGIKTQFGATDAMERFATVMDRIGFGSPGGIFSRTSFEERALNDMLDLLDGAKPGDLVTAGDKLQEAKEGLNDAARDLSNYVQTVRWDSEAATEFRRYGTDLARYAWDLGSFANVVGTQMKVAGEGLSSVRSSQPPRDNRADPRRPKDFPVSEQTDDNPDYKRAVQVEENRQEAINQMNRLASFYAVSEESLAGAKEPVLPKMLKADVPQPTAGQRIAESGRESRSGDSGATDGLNSSPQQPSPVRLDAGGTDRVPPIGTDGLVTQIPSPTTSMEIDSVTTLPPTTTNPGPAQPSLVNGGPPAGNPQVPQTGPTFGPTTNAGGPRQGPTATSRGGGPVGGPTSRTGTGGGGRQGPPMGRPNPMGAGSGTNSGSQSGRSPVGRPTGMGPGAGRTGGGGATRGPVVGRPTTGGQPMAGRSGSGTSSGPRTGGRGTGIVGGTPQRTSGSGTGASGARIPRGNVIGGQGTTPARPASAARPTQSGVVGTGPAQGASRPTGRGMPSSNGVVGTPRSGGTPPRGGAGGFTTGGSGLSGDRGDRRSDDGEQESPGQSRPENGADDEETRTVRRRGVVPPVIE